MSYSSHDTPALAAGLYVVATPIGNLGDMSARAIQTLRQVDRVLCEDTRVTRKLLHAFDIDAQLWAYHDHNAARIRPKILAALDAGQVLALTSDAGTPVICDPGYKLIREVRAANHEVFSVPGPCAVTAALSIAGAPTDRFLFAGFAPPKRAARQKRFREFMTLQATLVFYETGPRLASCLTDMADIFGDRPAAIARELTKRYENIRTGSLRELAKSYAVAPKGEIVIIVHPPHQTAWSDDAVDTLLQRLLVQEKTKDAVAVAADLTGRSRKQLYARALELKI